PFLFGERCPGWDDERRGGFSDITPQMGRRDLYRGVQEGVLYNLYQCYQHLVKLNGKPKKIKLSGGILHSQNWTQMCADIFQEEMEIDKEKQGSLIGGAVLAMELLGVIGDAKDYRPEACERIKPDFQNAQLYAKKYRRYLDVYNENFCKGGNK
ncbi:FGGY-family carbohydrate kinase, partial [Cloacibacillus evryensis]